MNELDESYWTDRYKNNSTGWDIGYAGPLAVILDSLEDKSLHILIPGAGNGHEAEYALQRGFKNIHVLDFSKDPLDNLIERVPDFPKEHLHHEDFFAHNGSYDIVLEQTFFCALDPSLRKDYITKMSELLSPNGCIMGVMFEIPLESGPPFGGTRELYTDLFIDKFDIEKMERCEFSIPPREGKELYVNFRKK